MIDKSDDIIFINDNDYFEIIILNHSQIDEKIML